MTTDSHAALVDYYNQTWRQYQRVWSEKSSLALHYGYWDRRTTSHADSLLRANERLVADAGITGESRVLDAGCGVGGTAMWLARTYGCRVDGVTITPSQVDTATGFIAEQNLTDLVTVRCNDFCATEFEASTFDVVVAQESMSHADDKEAFLREVFRGLLLVADGFRSQRPLPPKAEHRLLRWANAWLVPDLITPAEMVSMSEEQGFVSVRCRDVTESMMPSAKRMRRLALAKIGLERPWQLVSRRDPESVTQRNVLGAFIQCGSLRRRDWQYCMAAAAKPAAPRAN
jgi:tocopherol O-methyltransferase